jgi:MFS family permease
MDRPAAEPPSLRPALPLLAAGFVILFVVVGGGIDTVSVFLNALAENEGWSRRGLSLGISVGVLGAALATPIVGILVDRHGVRIPMALGLALLAPGFAILMAMREPWHFVAANVLLGPGFAAAAMLPITVAVTMRVPERTALALGIVGVGSSTGALVLAPLLQGLIDTVGWRASYATLASLVLATPVPFLLFVLPRGRLQRSPSATDPPPPRLRDELRRPGILPLFGILVLPGLAGFGLQVHLVPLLSDAGHSTAFAASALGAMVGVSALGKLAGGWLGDHAGPVATLRLALGIRTLAVASLVLAGSPLVVGGFVLALGLAVGAEVAVVPVLALAILGSERFATLFGMLQLVSMLAVGLAPIVPGAIFDATQSYAGALVFWVAALAVALVVALRMRLSTQPPALTSP